MATLDEARTTSDSAADHVADHNSMHERFNWAFPGLPDGNARRSTDWDVWDDFEGTSLGGSWTALGSSTVTVADSWATGESSTAGSSSLSSRGGFGAYRTDLPTGDFQVVAKLAVRHNASNNNGDVRASIFIAETAGPAVLAGGQTSVGTTVDIMNLTTYNRASEWSTYGGSVDSLQNAALAPLVQAGIPFYVRMDYDDTAGEITSYHSFGGPWMQWKTYTDVDAPTDAGFVVYSNAGQLYSDDGVAVDWFGMRGI